MIKIKNKSKKERRSRIIYTLGKKNPDAAQ